MKSQAEFLSQKYQDAQQTVDAIMSKGGPGSGRHKENAEAAATDSEHKEAAKYHQERANDLESQGRPDSAEKHQAAYELHRRAANSSNREESKQARDASREAHKFESKNTTK